MICEKNPFTTAVSMPKRVHLAPWSTPLKILTKPTGGVTLTGSEGWVGGEGKKLVNIIRLYVKI